MSNILGIIGSILIMPILIIGVSYFIYTIVMLVKEIIEEFKKGIFAGLLLTAVAIGIVGFLLILIAICLQ